MNIQLIDRKEATIREREIRERAFDVAKSQDTLPGYCDEDVCKRWRVYARLTQLGDNEQCIFIDGKPAKKITDFEVSKGEYVVGDICGKNISKARLEDGMLTILFADGVEEYYQYSERNKFFRFSGTNTDLNTEFQSGSKN